MTDYRGEIEGVQRMVRERVGGGRSLSGELSRERREEAERETAEEERRRAETEERGEEGEIP